MEETTTDLKLKNQEDKFTLMFEQNAKEHNDIIVLITKMGKELSDKIDDIGENKANKWVESVVKSFLGAVGFGVISFIGYYLWALIKFTEGR